MKINGYALLIYTFLMLIGGIIGYVKSGSLPSIVASGIFSSLLLIAAYRMFKRLKGGEILALINVLALDAFFTLRFSMNPKFMPAGLMIVLSNLMLIMLLVGLKKRNKLPFSS